MSRIQAPADLPKYLRGPSYVPAERETHGRIDWEDYDRQFEGKRAAANRASHHQKIVRIVQRVSIHTRPTRPEVEAEFYRLLNEWKRDTMRVSDVVAATVHPAHLAIIGMGVDALPCIFRDLAAGGGPWYVALASITRDNMVSVRAGKSARKLREEWLEWGKANGYLGS